MSNEIQDISDVLEPKKQELEKQEVEANETPEVSEAETLENNESSVEEVSKEPEVSKESEEIEKLEEKKQEHVKEDKGLDKRLAKLLADRKQLREQVERLEQSPKALEVSGVLDPNDFNDINEYKQAYAQQKTLKFQRDQRQLLQTNPEVKELIEDDNNRFKLGVKTANATMIDIIKESPIGIKIWHHLLEEPEEAIRIAALSPTSTAKELGKLEMLLENEEPKRTIKSPKALPTPPKPIKSSTASLPSKGIESRFSEY